MTNPVEAIARALYSRMAPKKPFDKISPFAQERMHALAIIALQALKDNISEEIIAAGCAVIACDFETGSSQDAHDNTIEVFQAMIDATLKEHRK